MKADLAFNIDRLAQQAFAADELHLAYVLAITCGALQRGDIVDLSDAVGDFTKAAIFKQTLQQLQSNVANSGGEPLGFSEN